VIILLGPLIAIRGPFFLIYFLPDLYSMYILTKLVVGY